MSAPAGLPDSTTRHPADYPILTVLVSPFDDPADRDAVRYVKTSDPVWPWKPLSGHGRAHLERRNDSGMHGWRVQSFDEVRAALSGGAR